MNAIILDCEIVNAIQGRNEPRVEGVRYCRGWDDHAGMGISCVGVYEYETDRCRVYCKDNFAALQKSVESAGVVITYNGFGFDHKLVRAALGWNLDDKGYDLLREIWVAAGLSPTFSYPSHIGYGLADVSQANGGPPKTGHGATAPVLWQQGKVGEVIDYCLHDVWLTRRLVDQVRRGVPIACPKTGALLNVRPPF